MAAAAGAHRLRPDGGEGAVRARPRPRPLQLRRLPPVHRGQRRRRIGRRRRPPGARRHARHGRAAAGTKLTPVEGKIRFKAAPRRGKIDGHFSFPEIGLLPHFTDRPVHTRPMQARPVQARPVQNGATDQIPGKKSGRQKKSVLALPSDDNTIYIPWYSQNIIKWKSD